ncbi:MAG: 3'(2'),5'-bisphosphate nucleotidase CysQ, partial [Alphaproteobacteria bacterium]|nr:3'(2'),5'-bisphosphate nucleotidase CysQ [Alphaproteobacteria bacterium]
SLPLQLRLAAVASGQADGAISLGQKNDWDLAAGDLLVHEAGGRAASLAGETFVYNRRESWQHGLVAAGVSRHRALIGAIEDQ